VLLPPTSVVIPTYNRAKMVGRAVESVLAAISHGDEVIVVDDGSNDGTERVLKPYAGRIRYVRTSNGGAGKARNRGIEEARNPLVAFLDSDDEWMPDRLQLGRRLLAARQDVLFCFSDFGLRDLGHPDQHGGLAGWHKDSRSWDEILGPRIRYSEIATLPAGRDDTWVHFGNLYGRLLEASYVPVQTLLVRRPEAGDALRFAEDLPTYEDWECVARLARVGCAAYLDCETAWQWRHDSPRLTDADEFLRATARIAIIERVWANDPDYLAREGERVRAVVHDLQLIRAKWLIRQGRNHEAREALRCAGETPASHRLLAAMPGIVTREVFALRAFVRHRGWRASSVQPRAVQPAEATIAGTGVITFRLFRGAEGLAQIREDWDTVVRGMQHPRYFHCFPWYAAFARTLCDDPSLLRFFVAYSDGKPIAVFPLSSGKRTLAGVPARTLEFPQHEHLTICDFVFELSPANAGIVASLLEHLRREQPEPWDVLFIDGVLEDSAAWFSLTSRPPPPMLAEPRGRCDYFDRTPFDQRLGGFSKNFRGALRKARNKLAQQAGVEFIHALRPGEIAAALEEFFDVEASGWKGSAGSAIRSDPRLVAFYRAVSSGFGAFSGSEINLLRVDGKCIAGQFCLKVGRCLHILKIGYDEAHSKLAPGNLLLENVVRRSLSEGEVDTINLITAVAWHADWNPQSYARHTAFLFNQSLGGHTAYLALGTKASLRPIYRQYVKPWVERWTRKAANRSPAGIEPASPRPAFTPDNPPKGAPDA
jgi:glycosyltransferase involved in cell wall biosynthesis/CelD/BcsL family acetyltransferase involved in cellulose biosynthesis